jgi:hypothetical protein
MSRMTARNSASDHDDRAAKRWVSQGLYPSYELANNITQSIERIPDKYLSSSDRKKLLDIVSQARKRLVDRLLH